MPSAGNMRRFYDKEGEYVTIDELLSWVRDPDHRMDDGRCIPVCIWGGRGAGKCLRGDTPVVVNGALTTIERAWEAAAGPDVEIDQDGGQWAVPAVELKVPSLEEDGSIGWRAITRLYRQRVLETGRQVRLSDGSEITMTQAHRLRGVDGWQKDLEVGDYVAVPRAIPWQGESVDRDLLTLLAWQIAEGHEDAAGHLRITQKETETLVAIRDSARRWSERIGIEMNSMPISPDSEGRGTSTLCISSAAYRDWLRCRGYPWGSRSARKQIPDFVVASDDDSARHFLREFWAAEGHVSARKGSELTSASEWLMRQVQLMLRRFGVWMPIREKAARATNGAGVVRSYWRGVISGESVRRFASKVGIADERKDLILQAYLERPSNTNVEGIPVGGLLKGLAETSKLPQRALAGAARMPRGAKTIGTARLAPVLDVCAQIRDGSLAIERTSVKDSWAAVSQRRLEDLRADASALATFNQLGDRLTERVSMEVFWPQVVSVSPIELDCDVFDFEVEETHNYVASMICTHNTAQVKAFCEKRGLEIRIYHPAHDKDGQDIVGTPIVDEETGEVTYALPDWLPKDDGSEGVWFIDEINRATEEVLAGLMEPLGEGTISQSGWKLPSGWQIVVAANPSETGYGVKELDDAMIDRLLHYNPGWESTTWGKWALGAGISRDVVDFALRRPEKLATHSSINLGTFQLPKEIEDALVATPRSLTYFAALYVEGMPERLLRTIGQGLIGRDATDSFIEMLAIEGKPLPGSLILSEPRSDPRDPNNPIYPYDEYVRACEANPIEGTELLHASVEHLVIELIETDLPRVIRTPDGGWRPAGPGTPEEESEPAPTAEYNRTAQLAGRFLAFLPPENREEAFTLISRSAPQWREQLRESADAWLEVLAAHGIVAAPVASTPTPIGELGPGLGSIGDYPEPLA